MKYSNIFISILFFILGFQQKTCIGKPLQEYNDDSVEKIPREISDFMAAQENINRDLAEQNEKLQQQVDELTSSKLNNFIGFTAILNSNKNVGNGDTIVYETKLYDSGGDYNSETGVFTCEFPGLYLFTVTAANIKHEDASMQIEIAINGNGKTKTFTDSNAFSNGSNVLVHQLSIGDTVRVRVYNGSGGLSGSGLNSFTGVLIELAA